VQGGYAIRIHNTSSFGSGPDLGLKFDVTVDVFLIAAAQYDCFLRHRPFETAFERTP
jgi:hypothetical protein